MAKTDLEVTKTQAQAACMDWDGIHPSVRDIVIDIKNDRIIHPEVKSEAADQHK